MDGTTARWVGIHGCVVSLQKKTLDLRQSAGLVRAAKVHSLPYFLWTRADYLTACSGLTLVVGLTDCYCCSGPWSCSSQWSSECMVYLGNGMEWTWLSSILFFDVMFVMWCSWCHERDDGAKLRWLQRCFWSSSVDTEIPEQHNAITSVIKYTW